MWSSDINLLLTPTNEGYKVDEALPSIPRQNQFIPEANPKFQVSFGNVEEKKSELPSARIPIHSKWFNENSIHFIEKQALPEYFTGEYPSKTPLIYMHQRNYMIKTYRKDPKNYLSATTCRRALVGDAFSILRVHQFLEKWGLINFEVEPESRPKPLYQIRAPPGKNYEVMDYKIMCGYCGEPCGELYYSHEKLNLCIKCFGEGNFPMVLSAEDFTQQTNETSTFSLSSEINLKLLEAVKKYKGDWEKVAEETEKPVSECMWEFIRMPIQEIGDMKLGVKSGESYSNFDNYENPLLEKLRNSLYKFEDLQSVEVPESQNEDLTDLDEKIKKYRENLDKIKQTKEYLEQQETKIQQTKADFLMYRIERSKDKGPHKAKKSLLIR